jgi:hypothetical protein
MNEIILHIREVELRVEPIKTTKVQKWVNINLSNGDSGYYKTITKKLKEPLLSVDIKLICNNKFIINGIYHAKIDIETNVNFPYVAVDECTLRNVKKETNIFYFPDIVILTAQAFEGGC